MKMEQERGGEEMGRRAVPNRRRGLISMHRPRTRSPNRVSLWSCHACPAFHSCPGRGPCVFVDGLAVQLFDSNPQRPPSPASSTLAWRRYASPLHCRLPALPRRQLGLHPRVVAICTGHKEGCVGAMGMRRGDGV